jgi:D-beta-D-heptose 7-phosphate kinase/D-beta-D-heptose 1-phosphate adenosyltransferase
MKTVAISGGFDPLHVGHIEMMKEAKALGDRLVVILNNDNWLLNKKGFVFMNEQERKIVIEAIRYVDEVIITGHGPNAEDMSVCKELEALKPDIFANGGDRDKKNADTSSSTLSPEQTLCQRLGIKMEFNIGHSGKIQSSTDLVKRVREIKNLGEKKF